MSITVKKLMTNTGIAATASAFAFAAFVGNTAPANAQQQSQAQSQQNQQEQDQTQSQAQSQGQDQNQTATGIGIGTGGDGGDGGDSQSSSSSSAGASADSGDHHSSNRTSIDFEDRSDAPDLASAIDDCMANWGFSVGGLPEGGGFFWPMYFDKCALDQKINKMIGSPDASVRLQGLLASMERHPDDLVEAGKLTHKAVTSWMKLKSHSTSDMPQMAWALTEGSGLTDKDLCYAFHEERDKAERCTKGIEYYTQASNENGNGVTSNGGGSQKKNRFLDREPGR